jgi:Cytochrome c554 and c-prime
MDNSLINMIFMRFYSYIRTLKASSGFFKHTCVMLLCLSLTSFAVAQEKATDVATQKNQTALGEIDPHADAFAETNYPSATTCATCHPKVFWEWAASNHAYASISPMFHKFEQAVNDLTSGTMGSFCVRCHQQVGTQRGEGRAQPLWERSTIGREGVTCITCHRVSQEFGKVNGERHITPGDSNAPVFNSVRGTVMGNVIEDKDYYRVSTQPGEPGRKIHRGAIKFEQINKSEFCVSCHQVQVNLGIKLEVVWDQYRASPAASKGTTCQECHMGKVPGHADGFDTWPIAIVNGRVVGDTNSRHSNLPNRSPRRISF